MLIKWKNKTYPSLQASGNASRFAIPFAQEFCKGIVYDVGFSKNEWKFPGSKGIDIEDDTVFHAMNLPYGRVDAIFSSHFLEHYLGRFQDVIEYWLSLLEVDGIIFLYLPNCERQLYWAHGNKKHIHYLTPKIMREYCKMLDVDWFFVTPGCDLNSSFYVVIRK